MGHRPIVRSKSETQGEALVQNEVQAHMDHFGKRDRIVPSTQGVQAGRPQRPRQLASEAAPCSGLARLR